MSELLTLPIFIKLQGAVCALVGEGEVAARKRVWLARAGAQIREFSSTAAASEVLACQPQLIIVAHSVWAEAIATQAQAQQIPVNVVDQPALCSFIFPSIVERGALTIAITSNGRLPVLARLLRARIESWLAPELAATVEHLASLRAAIAERLPDLIKRRLFWDQLLQRELVTPGKQQYSTQQIEQLIAELTALDSGEIAVVGAGPNDISQLTLAALQALQQADLILAQDDVDPAIVALARRDSEQLPMSFDALAELEAAARVGKRCVYLLTGDPLSHPQMAQQLALWHVAGIPYRVVAGIIDQTGMNFYADRF